MRGQHGYQTIAGASMASIGLFTEVISEWLPHFFYVSFKIAEGTLAAGRGNYVISPPYTSPEGVQILLLTRIFIWLFIAFGIFLVVWGLREKERQNN